MSSDVRVNYRKLRITSIDMHACRHASQKKLNMGQSTTDTTCVRVKLRGTNLKDPNSLPQTMTGYIEGLCNVACRARHGSAIARRHGKAPDLRRRRNFAIAIQEPGQNSLQGERISLEDALERQPANSSVLHAQRRIKPRPGYRYEQDMLACFYSLTSRPPLSSYAALAHRMDLPAILRDDLAVVEQCCTCPSYWEELEENLNEVKQLVPESSSTPAQWTHFQDDQRNDNQMYASIGNEVLGMLASEWISHRFPHLPLK